LAGHERRASDGPVIDDLEKVPGLGGGDGHETPVVEDEKVRPRQLGGKARVGAVAPGRRQLAQEPGDPVVTGPEALPAGGVGQGAGDEGLAHARGAGDDDVPVGVEPPAGDQASHHAPVQPSGMPVVDVLGAGREPKAGLLQKALQAPVASGGPLPVDDEPEAFLEREIVLGAVHLFLESLILYSFSRVCSPRRARWRG